MLVYWHKCNASQVHLITNHCFNKQDMSLQIFDLTFAKKWCSTCLLLFFYVKKILAEIKLQFVERKTSEVLPFIISTLLPSFKYYLYSDINIIGINTTTDILKLLYHVISRAIRQVKFETILKYHKWYLRQIVKIKKKCELLVYPRTTQEFI